MTEEREIQCPLLLREISDGLCLEVILAVNGELKKDAVPEVNDWERAKEICPRCQAYYKE